MMTALKQVESHVRNFFNKGRTQIPEILVRHPIKVFSRHIYSGKFFKIEGGEIKLQPLVKRDLQDVKELLLALGRSNESCGKAIERIKKKAKSGLLNRAIGKEDLIDKSRKFRFEREKARVAKMRDKPWREDWETSSKSKLRRASQINTENKLIRCGIDFDNCLDKQDHRNYYLSSLKEGEKELVRVDDRGCPCCLILYDTRTRLIDEIKGPGNTCPLIHKELIEGIIKYLKLQTGDCSDAKELSISIMRPRRSKPLL